MILDETGWFAICFVTFVALAYIPVKKAILGFLDSNIKTIHDELSETQNAKMSAEHELEELHKLIALSDKEHKDMLEKAKLEIAKLYEERCAEFKKSIEYRKKASEASLEQMKLDATAAIEGAFLDLVIDRVVSHISANSSGKMDIEILKNAS